MPQSRYTTTVELEAQQAAVRQILARNAKVEAPLPGHEDDVAPYVIRMALAASIARAYRQRVTL